VSTLQGLREVVEEHGLFCAFYTDRASHYFYTAKAGEKVSRTQLTQVGRALARLGIEHIAAYSPEARGRSERLFRTLQDRLPKELRLAGITTVAAANVWLRETYMAAHNAAFAIAPEAEGTAFVADPAGAWREILCIEEERVVGNDNTLAWNGRRLQLPASRLRPHFVKATVRVHAYPDGTVSVFLGPHRLACYTAEGQEIASAPTATSVPSCSAPSRRGLETAAPGSRTARRPSLTAPARDGTDEARVGTEKRARGRTKKRTEVIAASLEAEPKADRCATPACARRSVPKKADRSRATITGQVGELVTALQFRCKIEAEVEEGLAPHLDFPPHPELNNVRHPRRARAQLEQAGDPTQEASKTPYEIQSLRHFLCWIPERPRAARPFEDDGRLRFPRPGARKGGRVN
jgi:hypothetical protein